MLLTAVCCAVDMMCVVYAAARVLLFLTHWKLASTDGPLLWH